jgi:hypothetical protein
MDDRPLAERVLEADPGLADFFLGRLIALSIRQAVTPNPDERRTLGAAVFSTFLDCMDLGLAESACKIVEFARNEMGPVELLGSDDEVAA